MLRNLDGRLLAYTFFDPCGGFLSWVFFVLLLEIWVARFLWSPRRCCPMRESASSGNAVLCPLAAPVSRMVSNEEHCFAQFRGIFGCPIFVPGLWRLHVFETAFYVRANLHPYLRRVLVSVVLLAPSFFRPFFACVFSSTAG